METIVTTKTIVTLGFRIESCLRPCAPRRPCGRVACVRVPARPTRPDPTPPDPGILLVAGVGSSSCCVCVFGGYVLCLLCLYWWVPF